MSATPEKLARRHLRRGFAAGPQHGIEYLVQAISRCEHAELQSRAVVRAFVGMGFLARLRWLLTGRFSPPSKRPVQ
jgi:hypothetical protein